LIRLNPVLKAQKANVLVSGGTGLIGTRLCKKLKEKGYQVKVLSRRNQSGSEIPVVFWDPDRQVIDAKALQNTDYIIHLAGANLSSWLWTRRRKRIIYKSRVSSAEFLYREIRKSGAKLKGFITASGINYYGAVTGDHIFEESDPPGSDFLGNTCYDWEQSAKHFESSGIRTTRIRTGIVLAKKGSTLQKLALPFRFGFGVIMGKGTQFLPWIHIEDLCNIYVNAIENDHMSGPYNAVAPGHSSFRNFIEMIALARKRRVWIVNIPSFLIRLVIGEMAGVVLEGSRISSVKIQHTGYKFIYPELEMAMKSLMTK